MKNKEKYIYKICLTGASEYSVYSDNYSLYNCLYSILNNINFLENRYNYRFDKVYNIIITKIIKSDYFAFDYINDDKNEN